MAKASGHAVAPPNDVHVLLPGTCDVTLYGVRHFADVAVKDFDMRRGSIFGRRVLMLITKR